MATNPMQRKARNSFLLGMVITLLIAAIGGFFLLNQIKSLKAEIQKEANQKTTVYTLTQDVKSGQTLTSDMFTSTQVTKSGVPDGVLDVYSSESFIAKIDLKANTVITTDMVTLSDEKETSDTREQTYNMISLPIDLESGDYVDIRLKLANGQDYIVLAKKKVTIPVINGEYLTSTIKMTVSEDEILVLNSAIVDAYIANGATLYAIKYTDAGIQTAATITYKAREQVVKLISSSPNIVTEAKNALATRYNDSSVTTGRNYIDSEIQNGDEDGAVSGIEESTEQTQQAREDYLSTLVPTEY